VRKATRLACCGVQDQFEMASSKDTMRGEIDPQQAMLN